MTKQVDVVNGLNSPSACAQSHIRREQGSSQGGYDRRSQYDVAEIMVLQAGVRAHDIDSGFVIPNRLVKEVQTDAIRPVWTAHLGVEVIECTAIVFVDVSVLDKPPFAACVS